MKWLRMVIGFALHTIRRLFHRKEYGPVLQNTRAPDFQCKDESGNLHRLSDYRGRKLVLWFFIRADTPG